MTSPTNRTAFISTPLPTLKQPATTTRQTTWLPNATPAKSEYRRTSRSARMLQSVDGDGPPGLDSFTDALRVTRSMTGEPIQIGTSRGRVEEGVPTEKTVQACVQEATQHLEGGAHTGYLTTGPDVPAGSIFDLITARLPACRLIGRTVVKEGSEGMFELILFAGGGEADSAVAGGVTAREAGMAAATALKDVSGRVMGVFACSHELDETAVREGMASVLGSIPVYGGAARGVGWSLFAGGDTMREAGGTVCVSVMSGKVSFMISAVVKSWAQPVYVHKPDFMIPKYGGSEVDNLLVAIKFDDWDRFLQCLESVDVNVKWTERAHQSPLLAAAGRGRVEMVEVLLKKGADASYRNDGGFNAVMYTVRLRDFGEEFVSKQLKLLEDYGADLNDTAVILPSQKE